MKSGFFNYIKLGGCLAAFGSLAWLNQRYGLDQYRLLMAAVVIVISGVTLWHQRKFVWSPILTFFISGLLLLLIALTSPSINSLVVADLLTLICTWGVSIALGWLLIRKIYPLMSNSAQSLGALFSGLLVGVIMFISSLSWWLSSVEVFAISKIPFVRSGAEIAELFGQSWGSRYRGVFVTGFIGEPENRAKEDANGTPEFLAWYEKWRGISTSRSQSWLPGSYQLRLEDGADAWVQGIQKITQAWNWPEGGPRLWQVGLRNGDPVVIWADPGEMRAMGSGEKSPALNYTKLIAYGSKEDFQRGYIASAITTARLFGWVGFALIPFSLIPVIYGVLNWRRLKKLPTSKEAGGTTA